MAFWDREGERGAWGWGGAAFSVGAPTRLLQRECLSLPCIFFPRVCLPKHLLVLSYLIHPPLRLPQLRSQGSHFVHPLVADPGSFSIEKASLWTVSTTGTGQRDAGGPRTLIGVRGLSPRSVRRKRLSSPPSREISPPSNPQRHNNLPSSLNSMVHPCWVPPSPS